MTSWQDVASKALDFLQRPNALGVGILALVFAFLVYVFPMIVIGLVSYDNTNRLEKAITTLSTKCLHSIASRSQSHLTE